jgi:hypothetical protein
VGPGRRGLRLGRLVGDVDETSLEYLYSASTDAFSCAAWVCISLWTNQSTHQEQERLTPLRFPRALRTQRPILLTALALALQHAAVCCISYLVPRRVRRCGYVLRR